MGIHKRNIGILISFVIIITGCDNTQYSNSSVEELKTENYNLKKQAQDKQVLLDNWFNEISVIQKELYSIKTDEILFLEYGFNEEVQPLKTDKELLLRKIRKIKSLLDKREEQLNNSELKFSGLKSMIASLRKEIETKEKIIFNLKRENIEIRHENIRINEQNKILDNELEYKIESEKHLTKEIVLMGLELNKKYMVLFSKQTAEVLEVINNRIVLNYKRRDVDIVSDHPNSSYSISKYGKSTLLEIHNSTQFWNGSNNLRVRVKKRSL